MNYHTDFEIILSIICVLVVLTTLSALLIFCLKCDDHKFSAPDVERHKQSHPSRKKVRKRSKRRRTKSAGFAGSEAGLQELPKPQAGAVMPSYSHNNASSSINDQSKIGKIRSRIRMPKDTQQKGEPQKYETQKYEQQKYEPQGSEPQGYEPQGYEHPDMNTAANIVYTQWKPDWANPTQPMNYESLDQNDDRNCYNSLIQENSARHNNVVDELSYRSSRCSSSFLYCTISTQNSDTEDVDEESHPVIPKKHIDTLHPYCNIV